MNDSEIKLLADAMGDWAIRVRPKEFGNVYESPFITGECMACHDDGQWHLTDAAAWRVYWWLKTGRKLWVISQVVNHGADPKEVLVPAATIQLGEALNG